MESFGVGFVMGLAWWVLYVPIIVFRSATTITLDG